MFPSRIARSSRRLDRLPMHWLRSFVMAFAALACVGANAIITETEPNDTFGSANVIVRGAGPWSDVGVLQLSSGQSGDVDWFRVHLDIGDILTVATTPQPPTYQVPDTYMGLFSAGQVLLSFDDDSGQGRGSLIQWQATTSGDHYLAITGFPDINFLGAHSESGQYILTMSIVPVPEPSTVVGVLLGVTALAVARRLRLRV